MKIKEITSELRGLITSSPCADRSGLHRAWNLSMRGRSAILSRFGDMCGWEKLTLERNGCELYLITNQSKWNYDKDIGIREEFFFGGFFRKYIGDQFSFVDYLDVIDSLGRLPLRKEFVGNNLDEEFIRGYEIFTKKIFNL